MPDARIPLAQRLKDALSRPLRILPDDDPEWIKAGGSSDEWGIEGLAGASPQPADGMPNPAGPALGEQ
jgi:hypothetical protein